MQIVKESIFVSAIRAFFNALLAMIGVLVGIGILGAAFMPFAHISQNIDSTVAMEILPDANGETAPQPETAPVILQVMIQGVIGNNHLYSDQIDAYLRVSQKGLLKSGRVKGLMLYIDSPGGTVIDSDSIYRAVKAYKEKYHIPVYAYIHGMGASGGYMIACSADKIYSGPVAIVGSVGVIFGPLFNFHKLIDDHGIKTVTLTQGHYKVKYPMWGPVPTDEDKTASYKDLEAVTKDMYNLFLNVVTQARESKGLTRELLKEKYGAQIFFSTQAKENGYVDEANASYNQALIDLVTEAKITESYQVVRFYHRRSPVEDLFSTQTAVWLKKAQSILLGIPYEGSFNNKFLYYYDPQLLER